MEVVRELPRYRSHKTVWALKIAAIEINEDKSARIAPVDKGFTVFTTKPGWGERFTGSDADPGYYVQYADGFESWSPSKAFEEGYTPESAAQHLGLPVAGYKPQNTAAVEAVNVNKALEERVLRQIDALNDANNPLATDPRWLAVGRRHIEQGFMEINRAVFKPGRVKLPEDAS